MSEQHGPGHDNESALVVEVGNEFFEPGRTRAELSEDGQLVVVNRLHGDDSRVELRVEPGRARELVKLAGAVGLEAVVGRSLGVPDEPRYRIALAQRGSPIAETEVWRSDVEENPQLANLVQELGNLVYAASDGRFVL